MSQTLRGQNRQNIKTRVDYRFGINGKVSGYSEKKNENNSSRKSLSYL